MDKLHTRLSFATGRNCCCWDEETSLGDAHRHQKPIGRNSSLLPPPALKASSSILAEPNGKPAGKVEM